MARSAGRTYLGRFWDQRVGVAVAVFLSIMQAALLLPIPILIGLSIDEAIPDGDTNKMVVIALLLGMGALLSVLAQIAARAVDLKVTMEVSRRLRSELYAKLIELPRSTYDQTTATDLHDRAVNDTLRVQTMSSVIMTTLLPTAILIVGIGAVLVWLDWKLALVTLASAPVMFIAGRMMTGRIRHAADEFHPAYRDFSASALLMLRSQDLIRLAGAERQELDKADTQLEHLRFTNRRVAFLTSVNGAIQQGVIGIAGAALLLAGGVSVIRTSLTLGELLSFYAGFAMLRGPAGGFAQSYSLIVEGQQAMHGVEGLLADPVHRPYQGTETIELTGNLRLDDVVFGYDEALPVVRNVSLELKPGRIVALIGPNGSGKSSIVNLLLGFYRPTTGAVTADGRAYVDLDMRLLRPQLGVVTQDPILFPGTVRENITYGRHPTDDELEKALELSGADGVAERLPAGLDTEIGDDGVRLSGGQRQRIAIARALLGRPRVLIFDEPTNHLDESAISTLLSNLRSLSAEMAVLIVSHHNTVLADADVTIALHDGAVAWRTDEVDTARQPRELVKDARQAAMASGATRYVSVVDALHAYGALHDDEAAVVLDRVRNMYTRNGDGPVLDNQAASQTVS
ncbi:MAG: ABC transporter ATP-binding protein [Acidimicrobiales bacterium]